MGLFVETDTFWTVLKDLVGLASFIVASYVAIKMASLRNKQEELGKHLVDQDSIMSDVKEDVGTVKTDIRKVEIATNSMKDKLMEKTEAEGLARGALEEKIRKEIANGIEHQAELRQDIEEVPQKTVDKLKEK